VQPASLAPHVAVLARLLAGDRADAAARLAANTPPPEAFVTTIARHHLGPYLLAHLDDPVLRTAFDAGQLARLTGQMAAQRARQHALLDELERLAVRFVAAQRPFILLKGPYLAERFFGGADRRHFADLDLLVSPAELKPVQALLEGEGYRRLSTALLSTAACTRFTHGFDFARDGLRLDLHWALAVHASYRLDNEALWRQAQTVAFRGRPVTVLSDEHLLLGHLLSLFEDLDRAAARLKAFVDLDAMLTGLDAQLDWPHFFVQRRAERTARICRTVLALHVNLFACGGRFPHLAAVLAGAPLPRPDACTLLAAPRGALRNKRWAAGVYECSPAVTALWWAASLPFRLAVYHPGKLRRATRRPRRRLRAAAE
jgi:hypothetical protein